MSRHTSSLLGFLALVSPVVFLFSCTPRTDSFDWKAALRRDHPRLFFNSDSWPTVKARALDQERELFESIRSRMDELAARGELEAGDYGNQASEAAFVYRVTDQEKYLDLARRLLVTSIEYYHQCYRERRTVSWYSFSRINLWAAWDWIYNDLDPGERSRLAGSFLLALRNTMPTGDYRGPREPFEQENWSGPESGFYGEMSIAWYAGLATWGEGIEDTLADRFVTDGYNQYLELLRYRSAAAGDDGGSASAALNYALAAYPWAEFNFFHSFRSATGRDIAPDWPYVARLSGYIFWNWLPGGLHLGSGDDYHTNNRVPTGGLGLHLTQIEHFYAGRLPEYARVSRWLMAKMNRERRSTFPWTRFLLTGTAPAGDTTLPAVLPLARHFENMGQIFFRSGSGPDDTYALFTIDGTLENHKHFDHNHFAIYHRGFLALDTGSRPEPGIHLYNYYCRTIAHNCVLIYMPGEQMPSYWGKKIGLPAPGEEALPPPNDGGQREVLGSRPVAFETNEHYAYVAGDATATYHPDKCELALRQFVFLPPDIFVVFDRVTSDRPEYAKTWLLHTGTEPAIAGSEFHADQDQGRLFCRTVWPRDAALSKVGGPGKQFWSGGRNWPLPESFRTPDTTQLLGQWRVEVKPSAAAGEDFFLHLIQTGGLETGSMVQSKAVSTPGNLGVSFSRGDTSYEVTFGTAGEASGRIRISRGGRSLVDRELARSVQPQAGFAGGGDE